MWWSAGPLAGEHVVDLLGTDRELSADDLVVCAGETPASIAGVIGGAATAVTDATRTVLLEAATWDGPSIRATSKRLGLRTDASTLFEKGLSDRLPPVALDRAAALIAELSGGHVLGGFVEQWPRPLPDLGPIDLTARFTGEPPRHTDRCDRDRQQRSPGSGFAVEQDGGTLTVMPPYFRRDVSLREDLVEEVGRMIGYSRVPSTLPGRRVAVTTTASPAPIEDVDPRCLRRSRLRRSDHLRVRRGRRCHAAAGARPQERKPIALRNPLSDEWSVMRTSQLPRLCAALAANVNRGSADVMLFELGRAFWEGERVGLPPGSTSDGSDRDLPPLPLEPLLLSVAVHVSSGTPDDAAGAVRRVQASSSASPATSPARALRAVPSDAERSASRAERAAPVQWRAGRAARRARLRDGGRVRDPRTRGGGRVARSTRSHRRRHMPFGSRSRRAFPRSCRTSQSRLPPTGSRAMPSTRSRKRMNRSSSTQSCTTSTEAAALARAERAGRSG